MVEYGFAVRLARVLALALGAGGGRSQRVSSSST